MPAVAAVRQAVSVHELEEKRRKRRERREREQADEADGQECEPGQLRRSRTTFSATTAGDLLADLTDGASESRPVGRFWRLQPQAQLFYKRRSTEFFVAGLIAGNFLANLVEATIDPRHVKYQDVFRGLEFGFNVSFTVELLINMYAFWFWPFWKSSWNIFDFLVVTIGLLTTFEVPLPGPLKMLRMMRAFRVFRLFKRIRALKKIMESLWRAIPGVVNAFVILVLVMCIYAILAVEFWSTFGGPENPLLNEGGEDMEVVTPRGQEFGAEYFGNFPKAMFTMFQVLTGDSWSEAVARPVVHSPDMLASAASGFFFVSYVVLCAVILINVVVAVLLEKMVDGTEELGFDDGWAEAAADCDLHPGGEGGGRSLESSVAAIAQEVASMRQDLEGMRSQLQLMLSLLASPGGSPLRAGAGPDGDLAGKWPQLLRSGSRPPKAEAAVLEGEPPDLPGTAPCAS